MNKPYFPPWLYLLALIAITGCQSELPTLTASNRVQLSDTPVVAARLSPDGQYSYLIQANNVLQKWQNETATHIMEWPSLDKNSLHLAVSGDGNTLITASKSALSLWQSNSNSRTGGIDLSAQLGDASITAVGFWRSPSVFLIGTSAGTIIVADVHNNTYRAMQQHDGEVTHFAQLNHNEYLLSGANDGQIILWDMRRYQNIQQLSTPFRITSLAVSSESNTAFISDALNKQLIWDPVSNQIVSELEYWQQYRWFRLARFIQNDQYLITTSPKTDISLWDMKTHKTIALWSAEAHSMGSAISDMVYLDKQHLITITSDGVLQNWPVARLLQQLSGGLN